MKKEYKKPNICAVDFEILDLILASEAVAPGGPEEGWEFDDFDSFNGGYDTMGF